MSRYTRRSLFKWTSGSITAYETSVSVSHNLGSAPAGYVLVATNSYSNGRIFVQADNVSTTTALIEIDPAQPMAATFLFGVTP